MKISCQLSLGVVLVSLFATIDGIAAPSTVPEFKFKHLSIEDGLSQSSVNCILQDRRGFLWLGTQDGLNRYDGYNFAVYRHDPQDSTSISNSWIISLFEDRSGRLWVGTYGGGLNLYDAQTKTFTAFQNDSKDPSSLSSNTVLSVREDHSGRLWMGTNGGGLNLYDEQTKTFTTFKNDPKDPSSLSNNNVRAVYEDHLGRLWLGTDNGGLNLYDENTETFTAFKNDPTDSSSLANNNVRAVYEDNLGRLWVGTDVGGLNLYDENTKTFTAFKNDPTDPSSLADNRVLAIYEDHSGVLWVGTTGGGVSLCDTKTKAFTVFKNDPQNQSSLSNNVVLSLYEDHFGQLWAGTYGGGLNRYDPKTKTFTVFKNDPSDPSSLSSNIVTAIYEDDFGQLWMGTNGDGLNRYDPKTKTFTVFKNDPNDPSSISSNIVCSIYKDHSGRLYVGTIGGGLNLYDAKTSRFIFLKNDPKDPSSLSNNNVRTIYEDHLSRLWVGTDVGGLNLYDPKTNKFTVFKNDPDDHASLSNDLICSVYEDRSGRLWVGTMGGLNLYEAKTRTFRIFREKQGLPNDVVYGILEDAHGRLWLSTNKGLSRFDPKHETFRNYDMTDGLQSDEFNGGAYCKGKNGWMYFGGVKGLTAFYPDSIRDDDFLPPIVLTEFEVFNQRVEVGQDYDGFVLPVSITEADELVLRYRESVFALEFAALAFNRPEKNKYAYKLEGFDRNWNYADAKKRYARYTNLDPGSYTFLVKGSNHDGIWNEKGAALKLVITPPWWKTWWAYSFYGLCIIGLAFLIRRFDINRERQKARMIQSELRAQAAEALGDQKNEYLGMVAHDLRNPMMVIMNYTRLAMNDLRSGSFDKAATLRDLDRISAANSQMSSFVADLLDIASIESGQVRLEKWPDSIAAVVNEVCQPHARRAEQKGIHLTIEPLEALPKVCADHRRIAAVVDNLVSNAIKYTHCGGSVRISGEALDSEVRIHVQDTGQGLTFQDLQRAFTSFVKLSARPTGDEESTGLGLAIVKKIVEIHGGRVWVTSEHGQGSIFSFSIPL